MQITGLVADSVTLVYVEATNSAGSSLESSTVTI